MIVIWARISFIQVVIWIWKNKAFSEVLLYLVAASLCCLWGFWFYFPQPTTILFICLRISLASSLPHSFPTETLCGEVTCCGGMSRRAVHLGPEEAGGTAAFALFCGTHTTGLTGLTRQDVSLTRHWGLMLKREKNPNKLTHHWMTHPNKHAPPFLLPPSTPTGLPI